MRSLSSRMRACGQNTSSPSTARLRIPPCPRVRPSAVPRPSSKPHVVRKRATSFRQVQVGTPCIRKTLVRVGVTDPLVARGSRSRDSIRCEQWREQPTLVVRADGRIHRSLLFNAEQSLSPGLCSPADSRNASARACSDRCERPFHSRRGGHPHDVRGPRHRCD